MKNLKKIIIAELEDYEFALLSAGIDGVEAIRYDALSHIFGAEKSRIFDMAESEEWRDKINAAANFRKFKLEYNKKMGG